MSKYIPSFIHEPYYLYDWRAEKELTMTTVAEYILDCVVYIYSDMAGNDDSKKGGGSGFIVGVASKLGHGNYHTYAVTNKHVIDGIKKKSRNPVIRINKRDGGVDYLPTKIEDWKPHKTSDLAVCYIEPSFDPDKHKVDFYLTEGMFIEKDEVILRDKDGNELLIEEVTLGTEIYMVGRFQTAEGKTQNYPTVRFGYVSQMPVLPRVLKGYDDQVAYLVECHSISGFSGSPVFLRPSNLTVKPQSTALEIMSKMLLVGIDMGHLPFSYDVEYKDGKEWVPDKSNRALGNSAMMAVIPSWKLRELLYYKELEDMRDEEDQKLRDKITKQNEEDEGSAFVPDSLPVGEEFTKEDFMQTLKKVSKKVEKRAT